MLMEQIHRFAVGVVPKLQAHQVKQVPLAGEFGIRALRRAVSPAGEQ